jgi:V/A-type H+-transporting ATPase subunit D
MGKIKFTKGELKRQRDALKQFKRYLPTLQLKKQQLQLEILHQITLLDEQKSIFDKKLLHAKTWSGLLNDPVIDVKGFIKPVDIKSRLINVAGVDVPIFAEAVFLAADYDLFTTPLWVDLGIESLRELVSLQEELKIIEKGILILRHELSVTTQRVNLFEKVKIPEAEENIRLIKIYISDQMANAVGRSKIAKRKIEELLLEEVLV